jgi:hypothetical protein
MRNIRLLKIAYMLVFTPALSCLSISASQPALAQYYLVESQQESTSNSYQNVDYDYLSGVSTSFDDSKPSESDGCMNGVLSMFFSITGACVGLPLIALFIVRALVGRGVRNASIQRRHAAEIYLDAPEQPLRRYDPCRKSLAETVGK